MEEKLFGRMIEWLEIVHEAYEEAYSKYGLDQHENSKNLMEKIFQDTYQKVIKKIMR